MSKTEAVTKVEVLRPDEAIVVRDKNRNIRRLVINVPLSVDEGTLVKLFGREEDGKATFVITYPGFVKLAQACNVAVLHPPTIIVNGQEQPNPYQDPVTERVHARSVALGRTAFGLMTPVERTVIFDPGTSNIVDLISKGNRKGNERYFAIYPANRDDKGRLVRPIGLKRSMRADVKEDKAFKESPQQEIDEEVEARWERWAGYEIDDGMAIWVDTACPDVYAWQREMLNRSDKSLRTCQTFSDRNALSAHPAMPRQRKFNQSKVTLKCVMWYSENGNMSFDESMMCIDPSRLIAMESKRGADVAATDSAVEDISREGGESLDAQEGDAAPSDTPPAEEEEEEDDIPMGDAKKGKTKDDPPPPEDPARAGLLEEIAALEETVSLPNRIRRARVASGIGTNDGAVALADMDQLTAYKSMLTEAAKK